MVSWDSSSPVFHVKIKRLWCHKLLSPSTDWKKSYSRHRPVWMENKCTLHGDLKGRKIGWKKKTVPYCVYCEWLHGTWCHVPSRSTLIMSSAFSGSFVMMLLTFHVGIVSIVQFHSLLSFPGLVIFESVRFCFLVGLWAINYPLPAS